MAKILTVCNRLQAGDYENGTTYRRRDVLYLDVVSCSS